MQFPSALIRYKRLERNWSQEGLCEGICAVSYLSKIEQGKAQPDPAILRALMERLDITWHEEAAQEAHELAQELWESIASMDQARSRELLQKLDDNRERYENGPEMLNLMLLEGLFNENNTQPNPLLIAFENTMDTQQRAWYWLSAGRVDDAIALLPIAYVYVQSGISAYDKGDFPIAVERLLHGCTLAAEEGRAHVLLLARAMLGNCYSNLVDYDTMNRHYQVAMRLARDLHEDGIWDSIRYNIAATDLSMGHYEQAYAYFASLEEPYAMALHKMAVCLEKLGRPAEALAALDRVPSARQDYANGADFPDRKWIDRMCALVRYRLEHPHYLRDENYGQMLLGAYQDMQKELPIGFVLFHRDWVEEWYVAKRQYKQAYELYKVHFPKM